MKALLRATVAAIGVRTAIGQVCQGLPPFTNRFKIVPLSEAPVEYGSLDEWCTQFGWTLANVHDSADYTDLVAQIETCGFSPADNIAVASYQGLAWAQCILTVPGGFTFPDNPGVACAAPVAVACAGPVYAPDLSTSVVEWLVRTTVTDTVLETETESDTFTTLRTRACGTSTTVLSGTATGTVTQTRTATESVFSTVHCPCGAPKICPFSRQRLALLHGERENYRAAEAGCACGGYGMQLAIVNDFNEQAAVEVVTRCRASSGFGPDIRRHNAYNNKHSLPLDAFGDISMGPANSSSTACNSQIIGAASGRVHPVWIAPFIEREPQKGRLAEMAGMAPCFYPSPWTGGGVRTYCNSSLELPVMCRTECGPGRNCLLQEYKVPSKPRSQPKPKPKPKTPKGTDAAKQQVCFQDEYLLVQVFLSFSDSAAFCSAYGYTMVDWDPTNNAALAGVLQTCGYLNQPIWVASLNYTASSCQYIQANGDLEVSNVLVADPAVCEAGQFGLCISPAQTTATASTTGTIVDTTITTPSLVRTTVTTTSESLVLETATVTTTTTVDTLRSLVLTPLFTVTATGGTVTLTETRTTTTTSSVMRLSVTTTVSC